MYPLRVHALPCDGDDQVRVGVRELWNRRTGTKIVTEILGIVEITPSPSLTECPFAGA